MKNVAANAACRERVEDERRRLRIGAIVECQRDGPIGSAKPCDRSPEDRAVAIKGTMRRAAENAGSGGEPTDHAPTAMLPRTVWYTSSTRDVTRAHE